MRKKKNAEQTSAEPAPAREKKSSGFLAGLLSALFGLLLTAMTVLFTVILFMHALSENVRLRSIGFLSSGQLADFFDGWYPFALGGVLMLLPLLAILLVNIHRIRRAFLSIGVSALASAVCCTALGLAGPDVIKLFSGGWQEILVNTTAVYRDFSVVCAVLLIAFGAACLSVYACVKAVKGGRHEEDC